MAEITDEGYILKNQNEWFADEESLYLAIDANWNLDPSTPDGLKLASDAEIFANLDELGQQAYNSKDPTKAKGVDLNIVSSITGTVRKEGTKSNVELTLGGVPGTIINAGEIIESIVDSSQWSTDTSVTIDPGGTIVVQATALIEGATQASIGTLTRIVATVGGWQTVTNLTVATPGTNVETDAQLRLRRSLEVSQPGNNQIDNMIAEIFPIDGVRRVVIPENFTNDTDINGLPPHSEAPIVDGGVDADVALAIFRTKNPGCALHPAGTPVIVPGVFDKFPSNTKTITFSRPIFIDMIVTVNITSDGTLPEDVDTQIKQAIIDYTAGELISVDCGFNVLGFDIGEDVPVSRIYTPVNQVIGQFGNSFITGLTLQGNILNVNIAFNELSRWTLDNITVAII